MRVLLVTGSFPPGRCGVGDYSFRLARALAANPEIEVGVLTSVSAEAGPIFTDFEVFPVIDKWRPTQALKIVNVIRGWRPDLVHIQYPTQGYGKAFLPWLLPLICFSMGKKVVQTWHEIYGLRSAPKLALQAVVPGGLVVVRRGFKENINALLRWAFWNKKYAFIKSVSAIPKSALSGEEKERMKRQFLRRKKRLIVFFGFVYPHKGIDLLFEIADPESDQIVIAGEITDSEYGRQILTAASTGPWKDSVTIAGFLPPDEVAGLLAVADAVILPFRNGGGEWNTSIQGAVLQGTFVVTTSLTARGYDVESNVYYARPDAVDEMKSALNTYAGRRRVHGGDIDKHDWRQIANQHLSLYTSVLS